MGSRETENTSGFPSVFKRTKAPPTEPELMSKTATVSLFFTPSNKPIRELYHVLLKYGSRATHAGGYGFFLFYFLFFQFLSIFYVGTFAKFFSKNSNLKNF